MTKNNKKTEIFFFENSDYNLVEKMQKKRIKEFSIFKKILEKKDFDPKKSLLFYRTGIDKIDFFLLILSKKTDCIKIPSIGDLDSIESFNIIIKDDEKINIIANYLDLNQKLSDAYENLKEMDRFNKTLTIDLLAIFSRDKKYIKQFSEEIFLFEKFLFRTFNKNDQFNDNIDVNDFLDDVNSLFFINFFLLLIKMRLILEKYCDLSFISYVKKNNHKKYIIEPFSNETQLLYFFNLANHRNLKQIEDFNDELILNLKRRKNLIVDADDENFTYFDFGYQNYNYEDTYFYNSKDELDNYNINKNNLVNFKDENDYLFKRNFDLLIDKEFFLLFENYSNEKKDNLIQLINLKKNIIFKNFYTSSTVKKLAKNLKSPDNFNQIINEFQKNQTKQELFILLKKQFNFINNLQKNLFFVFIQNDTYIDNFCNEFDIKNYGNLIFEFCLSENFENTSYFEYLNLILIYNDIETVLKKYYILTAKEYLKNSNLKDNFEFDNLYKFNLIN